MDHQLSIRSIQAQDVAPIRHAVLWPSVPLSAQLLPFDTLPSTLHVGAFTGESMIGCLTITSEQYRNIDNLPHTISDLDPVHYQLHKFAILQAYQGKGMGRRLLEESMTLLRRHIDSPGSQSSIGEDTIRRAILLHFDARAAQIGFYEKLGFALLEKERFIKRGPTGDGPPVEYVKMGKIVD